MAAQTDTSRQHFHLQVPIAETLDVREFTINDGLASLFSVEVLVMCKNPALDLEELVGKEAAFHIDLEPGEYPGQTRRSWSGVVSESHLLRSESNGLSTYQITVMPKLWLLSLRSNCRVWQQKSDLDVAKELLAEWGITPVVECSRTYKTRKYRVQYQESDHAFVSRLLEAAGVTYYFRAENGESQLVLADTPEKGPERSSPLDFSDEPMANTRYATQFRASRALTSGKFTVSDHDHRLQNKPLLAEAMPSSHPVESKLESYSYQPGSFRFGNAGPKDTPVADDRGRTRTDQDEAKRIAEQLGAAAVARARRYAFDSNALDLAPGLRLDVASHAMAERVGKLLIARTTFTGSHDGKVHVMCHTVASDKPYRPDAVTPSPKIHGVETATVVGPTGETIHCDEFGRVRVQFHWDRYGNMDEQSSLWVHVNQGWAGDGFGSNNLPRIGQEVLVSFLGGDPEEPMVVGRIHTNLLRPPFPLPANKTQSGFRSSSVPATGGYNMMMFEDKAGSEEIRMRAEKDWNTRVNNDKTLSVGNDRKMEIAANDKEAVGGNQTQSVDGNQKNSVGGDQIGSVLGNLLQMTGGQRVFNTKGGFSSSAATHSLSSEQGTTISVGSSMIHIGPNSITIQADKVYLTPGAQASQDESMSV